MSLDIKIPTFGWKQVSGDMCPGAHGATIATADGSAIELMQIQPVREYVGDGEALEVGFPFWSKEAWFDAADLDTDRPEVQSAMQYVGLEASELEAMDPEARAVALACALLDYGRGDEGESGWARDVLGDRRVQWWASKRPNGWRYLADEDREFRALQREAKECA